MSNRFKSRYDDDINLFEGRWHLAQYALLVALLICANACLGLVIPTTMVMALDDHGDIAGLASSLGGMLQMLAGGIMTMIVGPFFDGTPLPMVAAIAIAAVLAYLFNPLYSRLRSKMNVGLSATVTLLTATPRPTLSPPTTTACSRLTRAC